MSVTSTSHVSAKCLCETNRDSIYLDLLPLNVLKQTLISFVFSPSDASSKLKSFARSSSADRWCINSSNVPLVSMPIDSIQRFFCFWSPSTDRPDSFLGDMMWWVFFFCQIFVTLNWFFLFTISFNFLLVVCLFQFIFDFVVHLLSPQISFSNCK